MVTYNDKILVPNPSKDGLDTIHPETNTGNVYDFVNGNWLDLTFKEHTGKIASTTELGHIKVDGTTIKVDELTGIASSSSVYKEENEETGKSNAFGYKNVSATDNSSSIGQFNLSSNGMYYTINNVDDIEKTFTVFVSDNLNIDDFISVKIKDNKSIGNVKILEKDGLKIKISTNESILGATSIVKIQGNEPTLSGGKNCVSSGSMSFSYGDMNKSIGDNSTSFGSNNISQGKSSFVIGDSNYSSGDNSVSIGLGTVCNNYSSLSIGRYNKERVGTYDQKAIISQSDAFIIGNGTSNTSTSNSFRVTFDGKVYGLSAFNSTGADYAEYFEWLDGNVNNEDRVGNVVTLDGDKIRKASSTDDYILGIISVNPSVIGDSYQEDWQGKYVTDEWGRIQYKYVDIPTENNTGGIEASTVRKDCIPILNSNWNNEEEYIPREQRKEWDTVGLTGKLYVRDDGTCKPNSFAKVGEVDGEITHSDKMTNMRVMERINEYIVRVFIK